MKTQKELDDQIEALKRIRERIRPLSSFGSNYLDAINAQIQVLEENMSEDEIHNEFELDKRDVLTAALNAYKWIVGARTSDLTSNYK